MRTKLLLTTSGTGLEAFARGTGNVFRKDFIREGVWVIHKPTEAGGDPVSRKFVVDKERLDRWAKNFELFKQRGISVPFTDGHNLRATGKLGDVVGISHTGNKGICEISPSDKKTEDLMDKCPEVSLVAEREYVDSHGNKYEDVITSIGLTPVPVIADQDKEWEKVAASQEEGGGVSVEYLSAEPMVMETDTKTSEVEELSRKSEKPMSPSLLARARAALKMHSDPEDEVHAKLVHHVETCRAGAYLSREDADKEIAEKSAAAVAAALKPEQDKITALSHDLEQAKTGARVITIEELARDADEDAMDMAATGIKARIDSLGQKATPKQKELLSKMLVGEAGKRNVVALSRKTASKVGLSSTLSDLILSVFEAGDVAEMQKLLKEQSGNQRRTELARDTNPEGSPDYDPKLTEEMVKHANGTTTSTFAV